MDYNATYFFNIFKHSTLSRQQHLQFYNLNLSFIIALLSRICTRLRAALLIKSLFFIARTVY